MIVEMKNIEEIYLGRRNVRLGWNMVLYKEGKSVGNGKFKVN